eukprot:CAMPEP_0202849394 /NCGR_PEP_ID=MMETSP1389-20130828/80592_1 /ASSEMBLY_ACC=CAM_ASM_000865 /TAXON_ID=302021 /ORGANISM="Rhodomonas sp., Strain CCMP768" /LENGTH=32 /DNA_ID= /DNA_START= /DNA_END= /DNA_ORIENTATION=
MSYFMIESVGPCLETAAPSRSVLNSVPFPFVD